MKKQSIIKITDETPNTHFFVYKGKQFPINFDFFKKSSKYFSNHKKEIKKMQTIQLIDENSDDLFHIPDTVIENFINYIHQQPISLDNENVVLLNFLATKYEVFQLIKATEEFITENHKEISIEILILHQNDEKFVTKPFEDSISVNFLSYIKDERLFNLKFDILYRILNKFQNDQKQNKNKKEIFDFLFKCIDKYGRKASVLFANIDFGDNSTEYINLLITKYSKKFDFQFINSEFLRTIYEQQNEILKKQIENENELESSNQQMKNEMKKMKTDYENKISSLVNEIDSLKKFQEEMKKQYEESLFKRLEKLEEKQKQLELKEQLNENKINEQNIMISKNEKEIKDLINTRNIIELNYQKGREFNGINNYLTELTGGNIHNNGTIEITTNSCIGSYAHPMYLVDFNDNSTYFHSLNEPNIEICFDFKDKKVQISNYTISSCNNGINGNHLKNWIVEVSDDHNCWEKIDEHNDDSSLNNKSVIYTYTTIVKNKFYRFVRLRQTGPNWKNYNYMIIHAFEIYGKLMLPQ